MGDKIAKHLIGNQVQVRDVTFIKTKDMKQDRENYLGTLATIMDIDEEHFTVKVRLFDGVEKWANFNKVKYFFEVEE